jgi:hypothetical protein
MNYGVDMCLRVYLGGCSVGFCLADVCVLSRNIAVQVKQRLS